MSSNPPDIENARGNTPGGRVTRIRFDRANFQEVGKGAFANVFKSKVKMEGRKWETVALKQPENSSASERDLEEEIALLSSLRHPNIIGMKFSFRSRGSWYVGMEFVDTGDLYKFIQDNYTKQDGLGIFVEVFSYQLFRGLAYLHAKNVLHRDLKPENVLVSAQTGLLKIIDFGCGKRLLPPEEREERDTYQVGTKEFRAPELLLHSEHSTPAIDIWSAGVLLTEMAKGEPLFGEGPEDDTDQFFRIVKVLGYPSKDEQKAMRIRKSRKMSLDDLTCCRVVGHYSRKQETDCETLLSDCPAHDQSLLLDLVKRILVYSPQDRLDGWSVCAHPFFDRLRQGTIQKLPSGNPLPDLFDFSDEESKSMTSEVRRRLTN